MATQFNRRQFFSATGISAVHLLALGCEKRSHAEPAKAEQALSAAQTGGAEPYGWGPFVETKAPVHVRESFKISVIQRAGDRMSDGHKMLPQPDGMACFQGADGQYVLLRNHELGDMGHAQRFGVDSTWFADKVFPSHAYRPRQFGGVSRLVVDGKKLNAAFSQGATHSAEALVDSRYVLLGTDKNCAGGQYQDYWLTCEESSAEHHGYAFATRTSDTKLNRPRRLDSWGRLHREAVAVDETTGIVYMTEDRVDGCLYRFVPNDKNRPFEEGRLEALMIPGLSTTDPYPMPESGKPVQSVWKTNQSWVVEWVPIEDPQATVMSCRQQGHKLKATRFTRNEGITIDAKGVWFTASLGGPAKAGQIFRLSHQSGQSEQTLELVYEVTDRTQLSCPDNLVCAPWGDLIMAEDNYVVTPGVETQFVRGLTRDGHVYDILKANPEFKGKRGLTPEFAGACFSPDGKVLFVNVQSPVNMTIAVTGPWPQQV